MTQGRRKVFLRDNLRTLSTRLVRHVGALRSSRNCGSSPRTRRPKRLRPAVPCCVAKASAARTWPSGGDRSAEPFAKMVLGPLRAGQPCHIVHSSSLEEVAQLSAAKASGFQDRGKCGSFEVSCMHRNVDKTAVRVTEERVRSCLTNRRKSGALVPARSLERSLAVASASVAKRRERRLRRSRGAHAPRRKAEFRRPHRGARTD